MNTILIVDDDPAIREIFSIYLGMGGFRVLTATGGMECLDLIRTETPDLILLDMMMEPMDGWATLLAIRSGPAPRQTPVIIITGKQPSPEEILQYGGLIDDYIVKPVDFKRITDMFPHFIEKDRFLQREIARITTGHQDGEFLGEYTCLLRFVRVTATLEKRFRNQIFTDPVIAKKQEERLLWLHKKLGFPDILLEHD
ncbi:MAG: response regulator, partial [Methanoregula sp.]|nr:response regulator [Methanoregula sp.]